ncbi:MAG: serine hydrolase domain-containing protein [Smithellaceae bacterium]
MDGHPAVTASLTLRLLCFSGRSAKRALFTAGLLAVALLTGCTYSDDQAAQWRIIDMLQAERQSYAANYPGWDGGMALYIVTPANTHFSATGFSPYDTVNAFTRFRAASTTKTFTAAAILWLHERGLLDIDDRLTDPIPGSTEPYLPDTAAFSIPYKSDMTIRQLLQHRAGVFDVSNQDIPDTVSEPYAGMRYMDYVREHLDDAHTFTFNEMAGVVSLNALFNHLPEAQFWYSNTGYVLLGKIIERVSGQSYAQFISEKFLLPLGLAETSFPSLGSETTIPGPFFPGFTWFEDTLYPTTEDNMSGHVAEGNGISSLHDLATWIRRLMRAEAGINAANVSQMKSYLPTGEAHQNYGLGLTFTQGLGYGHNGGHRGYVTVMRYDPAYDITTVLVVCTLNESDIQGQLSWMYAIISKARVLLGYPGL